MSSHEDAPTRSEATTLQILEMTPDEAEDGLRLSKLVGWNQTLQDWEFLLRQGKGIGFQTKTGEWVASLVVLQVGPRYGWISMVLTDPDWRRKGLAKRLLVAGIERLQESGLVPTLDATPAGEKVYRSIGFTGETHLARWRVTPGEPETISNSPIRNQIRPARLGDLDSLATWDAAHSGCNRRPILEHLLSSNPNLAWVSQTAAGGITGYIMGRQGIRAPQIGPLVTSDQDTAARLLNVALEKAAAPAYVDAFEVNQPYLQAASGAVWSHERAFTRMIKGNAPLPGNPDALYLAAGPELG